MNGFKQGRVNAGLTQKEAAINLGVSIQAVSYWENGSRLPSIEKLIQMADLYHVSTDYLLGRISEDVDCRQLEMKNTPQDETRFEVIARNVVLQELEKRGL